MDSVRQAAPETAGEAPWTGRALRRREDDRLLRGGGCYVNDVRLAGALSVAFVRSPEPQGRIRDIDVGKARALAGVSGVFVARDLGLLGAPTVNKLTPELVAHPFRVLAEVSVEAVGQAVAAVVAESQAIALDAAELVELSLAPPAPAPEEAAGHFAERWGRESGSAGKEARHQVALEVRHSRVAATSMEPRAALASWDTGSQLLTVWLSTQAPHRGRSELARILGLPEAGIRVIAPDVGGAFGSKASIFPEDAFVAWAARRLGGAVRWRGSRAEDYLAGTHGRGLGCAGELAVAADGRMLALKAKVTAPLGHWMPYSAVVPGRNAARILPGPYRVAAVEVSARGKTGPRAAMGIYRGAGRPEAAMLMERLADQAARRLAMDPVAFRRLNLVEAAEMPCRRPTGEVLDSGDYGRLLERAVALSEYHRRRREQALRREAGEIVGLGVGLYVEPCGRGWESAAMRLRPDGRVIVATGATAQGQGRETAFAQIVADALKLAPEAIEIRHGDTARTPPGIGAVASRSTGIGGGALLQAAAAFSAAAARRAARLLQLPPGAAPDLLRLTRKGFVRRDGSGQAVSWAAIAAAGEPELSVSEVFHAEGEAWGSGCCIAALAIDRDTGTPRLEHITLVDDAGIVINPLLLEGQLMGGLAQGVGEALLERIVYDADGQLLTGSLMDYALPRAADLPPVLLESLPTRSPVNPLGAKGVGEAGCIGVPAAIVNAAVDALQPFGVRHLDMPLTGETIWRALNGLSRREEDR